MSHIFGVFEGVFKWNLWKQYFQHLNKSLLKAFSKAEIRFRHAESLSSDLKSLKYF